MQAWYEESTKTLIIINSVLNNIASYTIYNNDEITYAFDYVTYLKSELNKYGFKLLKEE